MTKARDAGDDTPDRSACWCCGQGYPEERLVRLGHHPEAAVCPACARFLHRQATQLEDTRHPSIAGRVRDGVRWARRRVIDRGWHNRPLIGRLLRSIDRHLP